MSRLFQHVLKVPHDSSVLLNGLVIGMASNEVPGDEFNDGEVDNQGEAL
jgi:hypothetical protein